MSSSNQPAAQQIQRTSTAPWAAQQPYLEKGFERAETDILGQPAQYYPESTVVPFASQTEQALGMQEARAVGGSPVTQAGQQQVAGTAGGEYLGANPYLEQAIQRAQRPTAERFTEDIIPGIQSGFSGQGRYGSGLQQRAQERAGQAAGREMGDIAAQMSGQAYGDERQRQLQAASLAPQLAAEDYMNIANLANVGQTREAQAGAQLQEDIGRFQFEQQAPKSALADYMAIVGGGGYGAQTTQQSPIYRNKTADVLGAAGTAAGIAGTLFGRGGYWPQ